MPHDFALKHIKLSCHRTPELGTTDIRVVEEQRCSLEVQSKELGNYRSTPRLLEKLEVKILIG